ncbi:3-methyl-2-oxobutanoate hydroxymethyltransferase, partial [Priestia megaterium]|uniref:3-methyl-2-oxobutanoate hydroxymethyltransferase n=1 Tax=Priestia megaterium TaxID=1404 RepID=UPI001649F6DA
PYHYPSPNYAQQPHLHIILVPHSLPILLLPYHSTIPVTLHHIIHHTKPLKTPPTHTFILTHIPFISYHLSKEHTMKNPPPIIHETAPHPLKVQGAND